MTTLSVRSNTGASGEIQISNRVETWDHITDERGACDYWKARQELGAKEQKNSVAAFVDRASSMAISELISRLSVWTSQQKGMHG
jgi:hypothetical protein